MHETNMERRALERNATPKGVKDVFSPTEAGKDHNGK